MDAFEQGLSFDMTPQTSILKPGVIGKSKPMMRGYVHQAAFYFFLGAGIMLVVQAPTDVSRVGALIYVLSLVLLFGVSALYHRPVWGMTARKWLRRLDHGSIFVLIAGSATPILRLGLPNKQGISILWIIWLVAFLGVLKCFFWSSAPKILNVILYVATGFLAVPYFSSFKFGFDRFDSFLLVGGGFIYVVGAVIYYLKKPDPYPRVFGYHEIFHVLVFAAGLLHFTLIYRLTNAA